MNFKNLFLLGILGMGMGMSSCSLDDDDEDKNGIDDNNYQSTVYICANHVTAPDGQAFATNANYTMTFYYMLGTASVSTSDLSLGYGNMGFLTNGMDLTTTYYQYNGQRLDVTSFSGGTGSGNGVTVANLGGFTSSIVNILGTNDPINPMYPFISRIPLVMSYKANNDYTVKTFMPDAIYTGNTTIATVGSEADPFQNDAIRYRVVFDKDFKKADVIFYNAKFADRMPVTINFVLQDLDVEFNRNGYVLKGENLTPSLYESDGLTPAPNYQVTSFEWINTSDDLTVSSARYTVQIGPAQYLGTFQGFYVLSKSEKE